MALADSIVPMESNGYLEIIDLPSHERQKGKEWSQQRPIPGTSDVSPKH